MSRIKLGPCTANARNDSEHSSVHQAHKRRGLEQLAPNFNRFQNKQPKCSKTATSFLLDVISSFTQYEETTFLRHLTEVTNRINK